VVFVKASTKERGVLLGKWGLFALAGAISVLAGCEGGTTANVQNPAAPAGMPISITFQPAPPGSIAINGSAALTAVVNNDPTDSGVDWSLNCQSSANCGSLSSLHTASGQTTTYLPSQGLSANTQTVTVFAFATADHTKNINASIVVTAFASFLNSGTYILETSGIDNSGFPYQRAAAITLDGKGGVTSGEQTVNFMDPATSQLSSVNDAVTGGSYVIGSDGRGILTLKTADLNIGQQGVETFSFVALSNSQALLSIDLVGSNISPPIPIESCVGTMDLQTPGAQVTGGGFALVTRGTDLSNTAIAFGGVVNIDGPQTISGNGSKFDTVVDGSGAVSPSSSVSGTVSAPDKFGTVQISLNTNFGSPQLNVFTAYVIDSTHLKLIESDGAVGMTVGTAIGQGSLNGTFSIFSGNYAFGIFGQDLTGGTSTLASAGSFSAGAGSISDGSIDEIQAGLEVQVSDGFSATYAVDPSGRVDTDTSFAFATPANGTGPELVFYLSGGGNPALVLDADIEPALNGGAGAGGVGTGIAYPSDPGGVLAGDYGLNFTQNFNPPTEADASGQMCVNGSSVTCAGGTTESLSGVVDLTIGFNPVPPPDLIAATIQNSAVRGRLTGTLSDINFLNNPLAVALYVIDSSDGFFVETDGGANGANPGVLTFGYFSSRMPVCTGCP
jgi:hypothetical protein